MKTLHIPDRRPTLLPGGTDIEQAIWMCDDTLYSAGQLAEKATALRPLLSGNLRLARRVAIELGGTNEDATLRTLDRLLEFAGAQKGGVTP